jgi:hypothetical protein
MQPRAIALLVGICLVASAPAQGKADHATPQAVFDAAIRAEKKGDYKTFVSLYDPKSRLLVTGRLVATSAMFKLFIASKEGAKYKDKAPELDKLLAKHGVGREALAKATPGGKLGKMPGEKTLIELGKAVKDQGAFAGEIIPFLEGIGLGKKDDSRAELKDLEIEGDKATGVKVKRVDGKEVREPVEFVKQGRSWHLVAEKAKTTRKSEK